MYFIKSFIFKCIEKFINHIVISTWMLKFSIFDLSIPFKMHLDVLKETLELEREYERAYQTHAGVCVW